jgi:tetratricopeptide (TPR) repeat protein
MRRPAWAVLATALLVARPSAGDDDAAQRALRLFDESAVHYRAGRFERAIQLLEEAYALTGKPVLLFNLAKAYEGKGDLAKAIGAYQRYLRDAERVPDRGAIEARVATLQQQLEARRELLADVEAERRRAAEAERQRAAEAARRRPPSPVPWVLAGAGAGGLAVAAALGAAASGKEDDAQAEPVHIDAAALLDEADTLALGANVALAVGGALVVGGVTWGIIDLSTRGGAAPTARLHIGPTGVRLVVPTSF